MESDLERYRQDSQVLGEIGRALNQQELPRLSVRLPRDLADAAVAAWNREITENPLSEETFEERARRHRAGTLGLIGLSVVNLGKWDDDGVVVELGPDLIGMALDAADDLPSD